MTMTKVTGSRPSTLLTGGTVLGPNGPAPGDLLLSEGRVANGSRAADTVFDADGLLLVPGMVDIHGDAFERQVSPRPGRISPPAVALWDTDRQLAAAGITTAYHALTLSWEPGLRSVEQAKTFLSALDELRPSFGVDHRVQLRWEMFAFEAIELIEAAMRNNPAPTLALNDHVSMELRPFGCSVVDRPAELREPAAFANPDDPRLKDRLAPMARRSRMDAAEFHALFKSVWARREAVQDEVEALTAQARDAGVKILSHDDNTLSVRKNLRALGATIVEFPMTREVADDAHAAEEPTVLGAPNVMFGGSHTGALDAATMILEKRCDILASDYYYPAMLAAVHRLVEAGQPLSDMWALVSRNPAQACGLTDRGALTPGARADVVALAWPAGGEPRVVATFVEGRLVFASEGHRMGGTA